MKKVLIIGGNCDIGKALTNYFLAKDYNVVIGYHNDNNQYNKEVKYIKCDVTNVDSVENIIKSTIDMYDNIDMIINLESEKSYKTTIQIDLPTGNVIEEGTTNKEETENIILKRI